MTGGHRARIATALRAWTAAHDALDAFWHGSYQRTLDQVWVEHRGDPHAETTTVDGRLVGSVDFAHEGWLYTVSVLGSRPEPHLVPLPIELTRGRALDPTPADHPVGLTLHQLELALRSLQRDVDERRKALLDAVAETGIRGPVVLCDPKAGDFVVDQNELIRRILPVRVLSVWTPIEADALTFATAADIGEHLLEAGGAVRMRLEGDHVGEHLVLTARYDRTVNRGVLELELSEAGSVPLALGAALLMAARALDVDDDHQVLTFLPPEIVL